jgi:uncharacterized protein YceK
VWNRAAAVIVVLLTLSGCTSVVHYAVVVPDQAAADDQGCVRQCQLMHAGETKKYLSCLRNCPGVRIVDEKKCEDVNFDAAANHCRTEHAQKFDPTVGIIFILVGLVATIAIAASTSSQKGIQ